ncbi:mitochondrial inner membrane protein required for protein import [Saxophila tyrrhenica]|uniref:Mitochondrial import inner membrane translocase subunit TIM50 n=1 Tax=Saxophila tyrrhenica TaxID=1690608 RepID=A0AAV9P2Z0_9PEZI|nr:mitochondrial inner membrane protein required for protein import [Saxophila tyrrhenica]
MLPRAALRAIRPSTTSASSYLRHASPIIASTSLRIQSFASKPPRSPPPPPPAGAKPKRAPPPPPPRATGPARQTSPGTSFPKDKTWKPQDGIKFDERPGATTVSGAGAAAAGGASAGRAVNAGPSTTTQKSAATPVDGSRPVEQPPPPRQDGPLEADASPMEPMAQKTDTDEPQPGGVREAAHEAQGEAENQAQPPESEEPSGPLPDLRQGIPSTFDFEYGQGKKQARDTTSDPAPETDLTFESENQQQKDRGERDYDRSAYETSLDRRRARMANYLYGGILLGVVGAGAYLSRPYTADEELPTHLATDDAYDWTPSKMYARIRARFGDRLGYYTEPSFPKLLPEVPAAQRQPFTLVLSLEDLMIHSTWSREHGYRTAKRPGIDYFIRYLSQYYELVLFTSVPIAMADPVVKKLDPFHFIMWPLGREATKYESGEYVKDLAYLNRDLSKTLIIDTHAPHVKNQPENAIVLPKWSGDPKDPHTADLVALIPFLEYVATMGTEDVRPVLKSFAGQSIPEEFARREQIAREKFHAQLEQERGNRPKRSLGSLAGAFGLKGTPQGGMVLGDGQSVAEGLAQGKMLSDQIREQGQKQYEFLEKQIREHGEQWLKEEEEEQKKMMEAQMRDMKQSATSWFGGSK